jgi:hypothetical protein
MNPTPSTEPATVVPAARLWCVHNNCPRAPVARVPAPSFQLRGLIRVRELAPTERLYCVFHAPRHALPMVPESVREARVAGVLPSAPMWARCSHDGQVCDAHEYALPCPVGAEAAELATAASA